MPQPPQLPSSEAVLVQEPLHEVRPAVHMAWQAPVRHAWPAGQARPHIPQLAALLEVSTQVPPQSLVPVGHPQAPPMQTLPPLQVVPQVPQLAGSERVSMQESPHRVRGLAQVALQTPTEQA
jgi:hypothetical protein